MKPMLSDPMIAEITGLFGALGDSSRLKILRALLDADAPMSQGGVAEQAGLSQANASKHLSCLTRVGLVQRQPEGNTVYYAPVLPLVADLCSLVCDHVSTRAHENYQALK